jgi:acyl carrier protein
MGGVEVFDGTPPSWRVPGNEGLASGVEPRMRRLVADQLGVDVEELVPEVSLTDELAADSLDLLELTLVLESEFAIAVPERRIGEIRTYRDLVDTVLVSLNGRQRGELMCSHPLPARSRVVPADAGASGNLERAEVLTPYALQIIGEDAAHAGRGAHLDLTVSTSAEDGDLAAIRDELAWLERRGVGVSVRRGAGVAGEAAVGMRVQEE